MPKSRVCLTATDLIHDASRLSIHKLVQMEYVSHLRRAVKDCSDRGLYFASKWYASCLSNRIVPILTGTRASELLLSIPAEKRRKAAEPPSTISTEDATVQVEEVDPEEEEQDVLGAARSLAEAKEFMRASKLLQECKSARGRFMRWYYDFLVRNVTLSHQARSDNSDRQKKRRH